MWERAFKWAKRRPAVAALATLSAVTGFGMIALMVASWANTEKRATAVNDLERQLGEQENQLKDLERNFEQQRLDNEFSARGHAHLEQGLWDLSLAELTEAIRLDRQSADLYLDRGRAYAGKNLHDQAVADYTRGLERAPKSGWLYARRAESHGQLGKHAEALADCTEAFKLQGNHLHHTYFTRGCVYESK